MRRFPDEDVTARDRDRPRRRRGGGRAVFRWAIILLVLAGLAAAGYFWADSNRVISSRTVEFGLRNIGELATQAGYFTNVQTISDSRELFGITMPFTQKRYVYSYDGVVKAGINFEQVNLSLDAQTRTVTVTLPHARILSITVDENSFQVYDETKNIFNTLKIGDHNQAMIAMKQEITEKATANGILTNAEANAELLITGFLRGTYPEDQYTIVYNWVDEEGSE